MKAESKETVELTRSEMVQVACALDFIDLATGHAPSNLYDFLERVYTSPHDFSDLKNKLMAAAGVGECHCCCEITKPPLFDENGNAPDDCAECPFADSRVGKLP
jgi:hypothetical protein